jgi:hypothetical protein
MSVSRNSLKLFKWSDLSPHESRHEGCQLHREFRPKFDTPFSSPTAPRQSAPQGSLEGRALLQLDEGRTVDVTRHAERARAEL